MSTNDDDCVEIRMSYGNVDYDHGTQTVTFDWELQSGYRLSHAHVAVLSNELPYPGYSPICSHAGVLTQEVLFEGTADATCTSPDFPGTGSGRVYVYIWFYYSRASETIVDEPGGGNGGGNGGEGEGELQRGKSNKKAAGKS